MIRALATAVAAVGFAHLIGSIVVAIAAVQ